MNFSLNSSSPVSEALPSPNLTDSNPSSPKSKESSSNSSSTTTVAKSNVSLPTTSITPPTSLNTSPTLAAIIRSINKPKELNMVDYTSNELKAMKKRCRTVMTPGQSRILRRVLEQTSFPSTEMREALAKSLGMKPRTVQIWFQNQRQKSRQGGRSSSCSSSSEDLTVMGSPDCGGNSSDGTDIDDPLSSPFESPIGSESTSPGFNALTAAAFALSNNPLSTPLEPPVNSEHQRYSTFHGAVYKSIPGCMPSGTYRGNTAAAINAKRMAAATGVNVSMSQYSGPAGFLPTQPQKIPPNNYPMTQRSNEAIPLDILASAVSNFRPNGYNYYMHPGNGINRSVATPQPQAPTQVHAQAMQAAAAQLHQQQQQQINRNRLAPLRTPSPPSTETGATTKLPSLKALAQVASIGMEMEQQIKRSNSLIETSGVKGEKYLPEVRRFSAAELGSTNIAVPNSAATSVAAHRPW